MRTFKHITPRDIQFMNDCQDLYLALEKETDYFSRLAAVRDFYNKSMDLMIAAGINWAFSYPIDWSTLLNPIEMQAWCAIRTIGQVVLYPQFPVGRFTLDFGNPVIKIGLEIDGKDFHDKDRDRKRDEELLAMGWIIYRVSGREMYKVDTDFYDRDLIDDDYRKLEVVENHYLNTGEGVIRAIKHIHFLNQEEHPELWLMHKTLQNHRLI